MKKKKTSKMHHELLRERSFIAANNWTKCKLVGYIINKLSGPKNNLFKVTTYHAQYIRIHSFHRKYRAKPELS